MPSDPNNHNKSVASSVRSAFGVDENLQDDSAGDSGPSFFQRVLNALKGSDSLSSKINSAIQRKQDK